MKKLLIIILFILSSMIILAQDDNIVYSFFSAGHTYGNPNSPQYGLHDPFVDFIPQINSYQTMEMGFLTGDVVVSSTSAYWDSALVDINSINVPVYIAPGNHDIGSEFSDKFDYYFDFIHRNDLFIVLTPGLNRWNISGDQLAFLQNSLEDNYSDVNNIFIFLHELIWWSPTNEYKEIEINYAPHYPGSTNYEEVVKPLLLSYPNKITVFAGDLGCTNKVSPFMYDSFENVTLIGSGMGGGVRDNIIITNVYKDSVYYDLVSLNNSDPNSLGEIYDYKILSAVDTNSTLDKNIVYPNPASDYIFLKHSSSELLDVEVFNSKGLKVLSTFDYPESKINISTLSPGFYFVSIKYNEATFTKKLIIN